MHRHFDQFRCPLNYHFFYFSFSFSFSPPKSLGTPSHSHSSTSPYNRFLIAILFVPKFLSLSSPILLDHNPDPVVKPFLFPLLFSSSSEGGRERRGMGIQHVIVYYLSEHPSIVGFRWSPHAWGSTWSFLFTSISCYVLASLVLHLLLCLLLPRRRPIPLGPIPALHSLAMAIISFTIFLGILFSAVAEIRDTRWFWRRSNTTPIQWLLCFPIGTRPSGRVFFWSYVFYVSRFLLLLRTPFSLFCRRTLPSHHLLTHSLLIFMSFLWLEFSQSFQVLAIIFTSLFSSVVYGYRFWTAIGLPSACFPFVLNCQMVLLGCNIICHAGVLVLHIIKGGGCNGIGAWGFNSVLNAAILMLFFKFYVDSKQPRKKKKKERTGKKIN